MRYSKNIVHKVWGNLELESANGYSATYKCVDSLGSITFSKGKYLEDLKDKKIREIKIKKS